MKHLLAAVSTAALLIAGAAGLASAAQQVASQQDRQFVKEALASGQEEVAAGRLAQAQGGSPAVREFGRWMVTDHTLMGHLLQHHAKEAGIDTTAGQPSPGALNELKPLHDREFDLRYVSMEVEDHQKAVSLFQKEAQSGQNEGLKTLAQLAVPALQEHLAEAKELNNLLYGTTTRVNEQSVPSAAPPATATRATTATDQPPAVKEMNKEGLERIEKEGK